MPEEDFTPIYIPTRWIPVIYRRLGELAAEEADSGEAAGAGRAPLTDRLLWRMFAESQSQHRRLMIFLARRPNTWFYTSDLARELDLQHGSKAIAGMLGAFGRRSKNRYHGLTPWESEWDPVKEEARHRMAAPIADRLLTLIRERDPTAISPG